MLLGKKNRESSRGGKRKKGGGGGKTNQGHVEKRELNRPSQREWKGRATYRGKKELGGRE